MMEEALRQLIDEACGALGWLQGLVQLSDRARTYKIKKLQEAICVAEAYLESDQASLENPMCGYCNHLYDAETYISNDILADQKEMENADTGRPAKC